MLGNSRARRRHRGGRAARRSRLASPAQAQDKPPIKIGFLPPITGPLASPGAEMVNGFRLFWEQAGMTAGGRKIEIVSRRYDLQPGSGADAGAPPRAAGEGAFPGRAAVRS